MRAALTARRTLAFAAAALVSALIAACAHATPHAPGVATTQSTASDSVSTPIALRIESHNSSDVIIYAGQGRMRQRLGTVSGTTTRMLAIPVRFVAAGAGFYLVAHRVGGGPGTDLVSRTVTVQPGQTVVWTLEAELPSSSLSIE